MELKMKLFVFVLSLCIFSLVNAKSEAGNKPDKRKQTKTNRVADKVKTSQTASGEFVFPDELELDFSVDGEYEVHAMSRKMADHKDMPTYDSAGRKQERSRKNQELYADDNGAYQVSASKKDDGSVETDVKALYRNGKGEKCFYARQESHCWNIESKGEYKYTTYEGDMRESPPEISDKRKKRNVSPLIFSDFNPSRILKVVYVVDQSFMTWFSDLNNGSEAQTIEDAEDYIYMLNNEITYTFRGIKEVSEASDSIPDMDIVVYAQGFYYPALGTEWSWLSPHIGSDFINTDDGLDAFGQWVGGGNVDATGPFDTATLITIDNLQSYKTGVAFLGTVCDPGATNSRVSMNSDGFFDVAMTVAHQWGHSLNSTNDGEGAAEACPDGINIMSSTDFRVTTQDTWHRWSTCSVSQIINHVNTVSTGEVPEQACWADFQVKCTNSAGFCYGDILAIFDGTPCVGTDSSRDYVCYRGDCLEKVDVCAGRPTPAPGTTRVTEITDSTSGTTTPTVGVTFTEITDSTSGTTTPTVGVTLTENTNSTSGTTSPTVGVTVTENTASTSGTTTPTVGVTVTENTDSTTDNTTPTEGLTVSSSPCPTTTAAKCSCRRKRSRRRRARCCRNQRTNEGTCCRGCRPNRRGINCIPRRR